VRLATFLSTTLIAAAAAFAAHAAPLGPVAVVHVTIGPQLQDKADDYGQRELDYLAADLKDSVERALERSGGLKPSGGTLDLVIEDALPNRPTMRQMNIKPGLSYESFGIGGAKVGGVLTTTDGRQVSVGYGWYETDIRWSEGASTWMDALNTFDRFARRLVTGEAVLDH
jgi:hypothetical protein